MRRRSPKLRLAQGKMKDAAKAHQVIQLRNQSKVPKAERAMCKARCLSLGVTPWAKLKHMGVPGNGISNLMNEEHWSKDPRVGVIGEGVI